MIKFKKALLAFLVTCVLACTLIIALGSEVKAETGSRYFGLYLHSNNRPNNTYISTYCMQNDKPVIKILEYNGTTTSATVVDDNAQIYCLQAGVGFGSNNEYTGNTITEYTYYHDLKDPNGIASNYRAKLPSGDYYNEMVWVLDNMINPRDGSYTDDDTVLEAAGTSRTAFRTLNNNAQMSDAQYQNLIEAIQQCVIWYFTNRNLADGFTQKAVEETNIDDTIQTLIAGMRYGSPNGGTTAIPQLYGKIIAMDTPAGQLAYYYITQAIANKATALSSSSNSATFDKSRATTQIVGDYYYVGPYKYTGVNLSSVTITAPATYTLVKAANANAAELSGSTDKDKINGNKGTDFYIKVPLRVNGNKVSGTVSINVRATYTRKTLTYWNKTGYLDVTQPLAEITSTSATLNDTDTKDISNPEFDLALRKYITQIKAADGTVKYSSTISNRTPDIAKPPVFNLGTNNTTARKPHEKDALLIEEGDVITYKITVYNEGDINASNVVVTDYLPTGLTYQSSGSDGWTAGTASGGYTPYTLTFGNISKYDGGNNLSSTIKTMTCKVTQTAGDSRIDLKNIAEITSASGGTDRDSNPGNLTPSSSYAPSTAEQGMGEQDDDDYEHLYLAPRVKEFDLALRKYITEIKSSTGTVKYSSTIGNRTPSITTPPTFNLDNGTTARKTHEKDALKIESGDVITYKIAVYNEADLAGSNVVVTDYLPSGLTYQSSGSDSWTPGTASNGYTPYTLNYGTVSAYNGSALQPVIHTMVCKVTATPGDSRIDLKNIAEITSATGGTDRDSNPGNLTPSSTYAPSTAEQGKGVQDDDDYEHLYLGPLQEFDLALRKYITEIKSATGTVKYSSTIGNRTPNIATPPAFNLDNGTTARKTHEKDALKVEEGDVITYKIAVYNEAGLEATNVVVTDYLPSGLTYQSSGSDSWTPGTASNGYTPYTLNYGTIAAYNGTSLQPTVKTMVCKVTAVAGDNRIDLKNIAEITSAAGGTDRDSTPGTITPEPSYAPTTAEEGKGVQDDDDYEHLYVEPRVKEFDLAIRKYITEIKSADGTVKYSSTIANRIPNIGTPNFSLDNGTTAKKTHSKTPMKVQTGDLVTYRISIYNEGNGVANNVVVTDYIPTGLEIVSEGWTKGETKNGYTAYTKTYPSVPAATASALGEVYGDIVCKVVSTPSNANINLRNIAEIKSLEGDDRDSEPDNVNPDNYNPTNPESGKGIQDDDDFEDVVVEPNTFDLALKKFIASVNNEELKTNGVYDRAPSVDTSKRNGTTVTSFTYTFASNKTPIKVVNNDIIKYVIRVYNEGGADGYAKQIKDDIPKGLIFLPDNKTNTGNGWYMLDSSGNKTTDVNKAVSVVTDEYGFGQSKARLLKAFDSDTMANNPDYFDVEIAFKVGQPEKNNIDRIVINSAEISKNSDDEGKESPDIDSKVNNMTPGKPKEDDEDIENIYIKYFDLSLKKWTTQAIVIEDGKQTTKNTGHKPTDNPEALVKVEVNKKRIESTVIKFKYTIRVTNEGEIDGAATEISEYVPDGLKFNASDNPDWKQVNGKVVTTKLKDKILKPGEYADVDITLTWVNSANNVKAMNNIAEISEDYNESGTPDADSIPNNKNSNEDDQDDAPVIVTMVTGVKPSYLALTGAVLSIIVTGAALLKKYVLS